MALEKIKYRIKNLRPPTNPLQTLFIFTAVFFVMGLVLGQFVPEKYAFDKVPVRIDIPFRLAAFGALLVYFLVGLLWLPQPWRKYIIALFAVEALGVAYGLWELSKGIHAMEKFDIDALKHSTDKAAAILYCCAASLLIIPYFGWFRWAKTLSPTHWFYTPKDIEKFEAAQISDKGLN